MAHPAVSISQVRLLSLVRHGLDEMRGLPGTTTVGLVLSNQLYEATVTQSVMSESDSYFPAVFVRSAWLSMKRRDPRGGSGPEGWAEVPFRKLPRAGLPPKPWKEPLVPLKPPYPRPRPLPCHGLLSEDSLKLDIIGIVDGLLGKIELTELSWTIDEQVQSKMNDERAMVRCGIRRSLGLLYMCHQCRLATSVQRESLLHSLIAFIWLAELSVACLVAPTSS